MNLFIKWKQTHRQKKKKKTTHLSTEREGSRGKLVVGLTDTHNYI